MRFLVLTFALLSLVPVHRAAAQGAGAMPDAVGLEAIREWLIVGFEANMQMDIDFCRAIPDSALRWAPTDEVRDYAEQILHITQGNLGIVAQAVTGGSPPELGDPEAFLNDAAALEAAVNGAYEWILEGLRKIPTEELAAETNLFGMQMAKWQAYNFAITHGYWTRGQLVPYLRMNGVAPPRYRSY